MHQETNWSNATRVRIEVALCCPRCAAMNRPGAIVIELDADQRRALCAVCAHYGLTNTFQLSKEK